MKRKTPDDGLTFVSIHVFLTDSDGFLFLDGSFLPTARVSIESFCFDVVSFLVLHDLSPKFFVYFSLFCTSCQIPRSFLSLSCHDPLIESCLLISSFFTPSFLSLSISRLFFLLSLLLVLLFSSTSRLFLFLMVNDHHNIRQEQSIPLLRLLLSVTQLYLEFLFDVLKIRLFSCSFFLLLFVFLSFLYNEWKTEPGFNFISSCKRISSPTAAALMLIFSLWDKKEAPDEKAPKRRKKNPMGDSFFLLFLCDKNERRRIRWRRRRWFRIKARAAIKAEKRDWRNEEEDKARGEESRMKSVKETKLEVPVKSLLLLLNFRRKLNLFLEISWGFKQWNSVEAQFLLLYSFLPFFIWCSLMFLLLLSASVIHYKWLRWSSFQSKCKLQSLCLESLDCTSFFTHFIQKTNLTINQAIDVCFNFLIVKIEQEDLKIWVPDSFLFCWRWKGIQHEGREFLPQKMFPLNSQEEWIQGEIQEPVSDKEVSKRDFLSLFLFLSLISRCFVLVFLLFVQCVKEE